MTAGTKIFLAIVAVLVAVLVVYYGFLIDDAAPPIVMDELDEPAVEEVREAEPRPTIPPAPRIERREERPRLLGTPRDEPAAVEPEPEPEPEVIDEPETVVEEPDQLEEAEQEQPLEDHAPVTITDQPTDDGGKDAPADVTPAAETATAPDAERERQRELELERQRERELERERQQARRVVPEPPQYTEYTVRAGDTMSSIAAEWFSEAGKWDLIAKANPFVDPNRLTVGQTLRLPPKDTQREAIEGRASDRATVYVVRSGDNLTKIARAYYNDAGLWRLIYDANRETIGANPARLRVGMRLTIPPAPKPAEDDGDE